MSITRRVVYLTVALAWAGTMGALVARHYVGPGDLRPAGAGLGPGAFEERWMGVYMKGVKSGYARSRLDRLPAGGYGLTEETLMRFRMLGDEKEITGSVSATMGGDFALRSFDARIGGDVGISVAGRVEGRELVFSVDSGSGAREHRIALEDVPTLEGPALMRAALEGLEPGRRVRVPVFDPSTLAVEDMELKVSARERIASMGREVDAYVLEGDFQGVEFKVWVDEAGEAIREETAFGIVLARETEADARRMGPPSDLPDIISALAVPFNLKLPKVTEYLKVRIEGVPLAGLELDGGYQHLTGNVLEIRRGEVNSNTNSYTEDLKPFLMPEDMIESDDSGIRALAGAITNSIARPEYRARAINSWVFENIRKEPTVSFPSALEVFKSRRGDCNEHTALATALLRSAGVPARVAVGLVYKDGSFYYHAWPEIWSGRWLAVDPTFGQFPADASHIRLMSGGLRNQYRLAPLMGKIRLTGIEYR